jgi:hypothetical protein
VTPTHHNTISGTHLHPFVEWLKYSAYCQDAEAIADIALCPFEAVKVPIQTQPRFARDLSNGFLSLSNLRALLGMHINIVKFF